MVSIKSARLKGVKRGRVRGKAMKLKKTGLITKIVILILVVYAAVSLSNIHGRIDAARQERDQKALEAQSLEAGNAVMRSEIEHSDEAETIIHIAREKFNLVLPGETVYYDIGG